MNNKIKKHRWQEFKVAFFYDENHATLSRTSIMNVIFFICSILLIVVGITAKLVLDKELPATIYTFLGGLTGGGFLQYSYTKVLNIKKQQQNNNQQSGVANEE